MSATRTRRARATAQPQPEAPAEVPALDLASEVAALEVGKPQRVYVDVDGVPRVPTADGTLATVQREKRSDGSLGEYLLAEIRTNRDKSESVQRYSLARIQACKSALESKGVQVLK